MIERTEHPFHKNSYIYKQKGSKNWFMEYKNSNGKRTRKTTKTSDKKEALRKLGDNVTLISKVESGEISIVENNQITVKKAVNETIKFYQNSKPQKPVYKVYVRELKAFSNNYGGLKVDDINRKILREYLSKNLSKSRLGMIRTAIRTMFMLCEDSGHIERIPDFPRNIETKKQKKREGLKEEQIKAIIKRFTEKSVMKQHPSSRRISTDVERENSRIISVLMTLLYHTGARIGELRYLKPANISQEKVDNKTLAFLDIEISKTKPRKILISYALYFYLKNIQLNNNLKDDDYFFLNRFNNKISDDFNKIVIRDYESNKEFYQSIGVKDFCLYRLRHTYIIERLLECRNIFILSQHCGTSIKMIEQNYSSFIASASYKFLFNEQSKSLLNDKNDLLNPESFLSGIDSTIDKFEKLTQEKEKLDC